MEAGNFDYLTSQGYVHIVADSRGSGFSEGMYGFHAADEIDLADLIDWAAEQPWCDGNVGTFGISMYGVNSIMAAGQKPKSLKAAVFQEFVTEPYRQGSYHGGVMSLFFYGLYYGVQGDSGFALTSESYKKLMDIPDDVRNQLIEIAKSNEDIRYFSNLWQYCHYPQRNPFFIPNVVHPTYDDFWKHAGAQDG